MPGLRCPVPRRRANVAGESQAEHRSASIRMREGVSQWLLCCGVMPQWRGGMLHLPDGQALRCPGPSQAAGGWQLSASCFHPLLYEDVISVFHPLAVLQPGSSLLPLSSGGDRLGTSP